MPRTFSLRLILPDGERALELPASEARQPLTRILRHAALPLNTRCGERGLCDGCVVELLEGQLKHLASNAAVSPSDRPLSVRACEYRLVSGSVVLRIPQRALLAYEPHVLSEFALNVPHAIDPLKPSDFPSLASGAGLGVAIDVGTTTLVVLLVDLATGQPVAHASGFNRQMHLGDDVLTRINLCATDPANLPRLQRAVVLDTIRPLLQTALKSAAADPHSIAAITAAGNTTMLHLLAGVDPSSLGVVPFTPAFLEHRELRLSQVGLPLSRLARGHLHDAPAPADWDPPLHLLPGAAAYVGADLVAGTLASGLAYDDGPSLLVDVGTNGEIILKHGSTLLGCATAAGPAFEGAGLTDGIRAGQGAIDHVRLSDNPFAVDFTVIANSAIEQSPIANRQSPVPSPIGLCGSAYIDLLAEGRRIGLLTPRGRFDPEAVDGSRAHLLEDGHGRALRVADVSARPIVLSETDIAALLQAKAAIAAGILTLLKRASLAPADIRTLYLAGGFGMHLNVDSAFGCGLLPGFTRQQVRLVGNSSLAGAYLALVDRSVLPELQRIGRCMQVVELNLEPGFEDRYIDQLSLP